jgi:DNA polymerase IV
MSHNELAAKEAYFKEQELLDIPDDEQDITNDSVDRLERALKDSKAMKPPSLTKQASSFLGPTPRERQAEFEAHTRKQRATERQTNHKLIRSSTAPEVELTKGLAAVKTRDRSAAVVAGAKDKLKRVSILSETADKDDTPFYIRMGDIPRELKNGKNVKQANNIKLVPEYKQLLKEKIVYFYPNDDIPGPRRMRIHKVIQLGAAWVKRWREDITHIIVDDDTHTYTQLLRHLNRPGFPKKVVLVKFEPYVPQCIQFGELLDPSAPRFAVKGAPTREEPSELELQSHTSTTSQTSLKIKLSKRLIAAQESRKTGSHLTEVSVPATQPAADSRPYSSFEETVEDSFVMPSSSPAKAPQPKTADNFNDTLSQAILETKAIAHLPLDEDEDAESPVASGVEDADDSGSDEESLATSPKLSKTFNFVSKASALRDRKPLNLSAFQCMDPGANGYTSQNPNARTIQILDQMCKHYDQMQDQWRTLSYRKCITTLKKQTVKITTAKQAAALPFIGQRLAEKIEEIVLTDRLRRLDSTQDDPLDVVLRLFLRVYGAGLVQANKWVQAGYRTLEDLRTKARLTESNKVGIEHYEDFNSRIPRAEVEAHGNIVIKELRKIDSKFKATIMGSYRRGAQDSGDIDMILTKPGTSLAAMRTTIFEVLVPHLFKIGFLKASLATSRSNDPTGSKWHGASCLPTSKVWRRIDFLLVPEEEMGAALIYFTGNDIFNRSIRLLARKKNMRLSQKGLYKDVHRGRRGGKLDEGGLVESRSEKKIFEVLGVPWKELHERVC